VNRSTAIAHPNIALIKYWGKRDRQLNLPAVSSLSLTLDTFKTETTVCWGTERDLFILNEQAIEEEGASKVFRFLDLIDPARPPCHVESHNNFPTAAGLASSASAFAALALAATDAADHPYAHPHARPQLSALARQGSGSACRSLWGGWVEWEKGVALDGSDSHGAPIFPKEYWALKLVVAVVSSEKKSIGSTAGMIHTEQTSPLYAGWVESSDHDLAEARAAIQARDLERLGAIMEHSMLKMHATMLAAQPTVRYWKPASLQILQEVELLRSNGILCFATMDAGPNVKILCEAHQSKAVQQAIAPYAQQTHVLGIGPDAQLL
jgi:diphosphomevalonate decarboxylase